MRHANQDWSLPEKLTTWEMANTAVLMDIRDELQTIRRILQCHRLPYALDVIIGNRPKKKPRRKK